MAAMWLRMAGTLLWLTSFGCGAGSHEPRDDDSAGDGDANGDGDADGDGDTDGDADVDSDTDGDADADGDSDADAGCDVHPWAQPGWSEEGVDWTECEEERYSDCDGLACADSPEADEFLQVFLDLIEERGYADRIEVVSASYQPFPIWEIHYVVVVDWLRATGSVFLKGEPNPEEDFAFHISYQLPDEIPDSLPPWPDVLAALRECDPETEPAVCRASVRELVGSAGDCGEVVLWWADNPAGYVPECRPESGDVCCECVKECE